MNPIPSEEDLELAFKEFESINWDNVSLENISTIIPYPLKALSIVNFPLEHKKYFYRARTFDSFQKHNIEDIKNDNYLLKKSFSYPPKDITQLNRANLNGFPVFYAASNILVAEIEMKKNENLIYISCWKSKKILNIIPFINSITSLSDAAKEVNENINNSFLVRFGPEIKKSYEILDNFNQKQFSKIITNPNDYKYSAWNSHRYLYELRDKINVDAIGYPTILNETKGTNFAIHPEFVDNHMELECVFLMSRHIRKQNNVISGVRNPLKIGIPENDVIVWRSLNKTEIEFYRETHHVPEIGIFRF